MNWLGILGWILLALYGLINLVIGLRRKSPEIEIIGSKKYTKDYEERDHNPYTGTKVKTVKKKNFTTVLYKENGELKTQDFSGSWDLGQLSGDCDE